MKRSFICAFSGIVQCVKSERNMRIHITVAFYVLIFSAITGISGAELACVLVCVGMVTGSEMLNTVMEKLCDALHPERSELIKRVKDISAGAVLVCAGISAAVGAVIFFSGEKIDRFVKFARESTAIAILTVATIPFAVIFVFGRRKYDK